MRGSSALFALLLAGCAANRAAPDLLLGPEEAQRTARGSWATAWLKPGSATAAALAPLSAGKQVEVEGELLAALPDRIYLRAQRLIVEGDPAGRQVPAPVRIPIADLARVRVERYATGKYAMGTWTAVGALSTPTQGYFAVFSFLIWILAGSVSSAVESRHAFLDWPGAAALQDLAPWARFPQGAVPGLDEGRVGRGP